MKEFFKELLEYSHHFNQKLAVAFIENQDKTSEKSIKVFSHVLNAHQVWNNRIDSQQPQFEIWGMHSIQNFKSIDRSNYEHSVRIIDTFDLNDRIDFTNAKGMNFKNCIRDVLFHVINHSTYHRGQIAADFRQNGIEPLLTEYILYKS